MYAQLFVMQLLKTASLGFTFFSHVNKLSLVVNTKSSRFPPQCFGVSDLYSESVGEETNTTFGSLLVVMLLRFYFPTSIKSYSTKPVEIQGFKKTSLNWYLKCNPLQQDPLPHMKENIYPNCDSLTRCLIRSVLQDSTYHFSLCEFKLSAVFIEAYPTALSLALCMDNRQSLAGSAKTVPRLGFRCFASESWPFNVKRGQRPPAPQWSQNPQKVRRCNVPDALLTGLDDLTCQTNCSKQMFLNLPTEHWVLCNAAIGVIQSSPLLCFSLDTVRAAIRAAPICSLRARCRLKQRILLQSFFFTFCPYAVFPAGAD